MADPLFEGRIEVARRLSDERADDILRFWSEQDMLDGEEAARRVREVVCVLFDDDDRLVGVNCVYPDDVPLIGGRRFWVYTSYLAPEAAAAAQAMVRTAYETLAESFDPAAEGPVGLVALISDRAEMRRRPEAEWSDPRLLYAGYLPDGRQARVGYFPDAAIGPGPPGA